MTDKTKEELAADQNKGGGGQVIVEKPETSWSTVKTIGMVGIVVGGAAIVGAAVTQILAFVFQGDATTLQTRAINAGQPCPSLNANDYGATPPPSGSNCSSAINYHSQALAAQTAAIAVGIIGGVVAIAGIVMFVVGGNVTKGPEKPAALRLVPMLSPNMAGLGLVGTF